MPRQLNRYVPLGPGRCARLRRHPELGLARTATSSPSSRVRPAWRSMRRSSLGVPAPDTRRAAHRSRHPVRACPARCPPRGCDDVRRRQVRSARPDPGRRSRRRPLARAGGAASQRRVGRSIAPQPHGCNSSRYQAAPTAALPARTMSSGTLKRTSATNAAIASPTANRSIVAASTVWRRSGP